MCENEKPFDYSLCESCQKNPRQDEHTCPLAEEINDDSESMCNCCDECILNCALEI